MGAAWSPGRAGAEPLTQGSPPPPPTHASGAGFGALPHRPERKSPVCCSGAPGLQKTRCPSPDAKPGQSTPPGLPAS